MEVSLVSKNFSLLSYILFFLCFSLCGLPSLVKSDSCSTNLTLNNQIPFQTSSLHCLSVWTSQDFILRYAQTTTNTWSFVLSAPDSGAYISIGFSPNGRMVGASAVSGWVPSNGGGVVKQYYLGGYGATQVVPDQGSLNIIKNSTAMISQSSRLYLAFQLSTTTQPLSNLIYAVGPKNQFPSSPSYYMSQHKTQTSVTVNYNSVQVSSSSSWGLKQSHGLVNMLGWGILMLIGMIMARYFKHWDPQWFYSHVSIQFVGFSLGLSGIITGFVLEDQGFGNSDVDKHKALGIFVLVLGCLQVMAFLARPGKASKVRKYWNWYHYIVGRLCIVCAIGNTFYGIHISNEGNSWNAGYGIVLVILIIVAIVLEVRRWIRK
ncbi:hypothetical protein RJ641_021837 [Dillenia turbinata]|uniref:Cytochrome b561 and DOMON domain-containing protein n=1 Tax=Dillenia turbinata TaxID=194707 RepID=A0AAN8UNI7_9MAGN